MPNPARYEDKLEAYTDGKDPCAMQADAPRILAELIEGVPELALRRKCLTIFLRSVSMVRSA